MRRRFVPRRVGVEPQFDLLGTRAARRLHPRPVAFTEPDLELHGAVAGRDGGPDFALELVRVLGSQQRGDGHLGGHGGAEARGQERGEGFSTLARRQIVKGGVDGIPRGRRSGGVHVEVVERFVEGERSCPRQAFRGAVKPPFDVALVLQAEARQGGRFAPAGVSSPILDLDPEAPALADRAVGRGQWRAQGKGKGVNHELRDRDHENAIPSANRAEKIRARRAVRSRRALRAAPFSRHAVLISR